MFKKEFTYFYISLIICVLFYPKTTLKAQNVSYDLPFSANYSVQGFLYNPSFLNTNDLTIAAQHRSYTGSFSDVNYNSIYALKNLKKKRGIGINIQHENTSDFFTRSRFYGIYQKTIDLSKNTTLTGGLQAGLVNFQMIPLGFSAGGSAWNYDLGIGFHLQSTKYTAGIVIHQIPDISLTPIIYEFDLHRFTEVYASYKLDLALRWKYIPEARCRFTPEADLYSFSNTLEYYEKHGINSTVTLNRGASFLGFYTFGNSENSQNYKVFFGYFFPFQKELKNLDAQQYELGVNLFFNKR